ncbi:MAG: aspartate aminotransferase family protein, partial [Nitrospina sp.]|nr:aspartate aminotransferase family protein [Nitrospina sp.]
MRSNKDQSFSPNAGLEYAINLLRQVTFDPQHLPRKCPNSGLGELETMELLAPHILGRAARLDRSDALAHMDPPTPWITWVTALWNASLNQNLLHPATSPFALEAEKLVIDWLTPFFGMHGGHLCSGSTLANLTSLWAARDAAGIKRVVASKASHLSIKKAARILGLTYEEIPTNSKGQIDAEQLNNISDACLVLTAGTTATGSIDSLKLAGQAKWTHVDAAWAGPLCL